MKNYIMGLVVVAATVFGIFTYATKASARKDSTVLSSNNSVSLVGVVSDQSVAEAYAKAALLVPNLPDGECIKLVLNTPGGSIDAGLEFIDNIKGLGVCVDTITVFAASMGFQIVQNLGRRYMVSRGELMSHKARGAFGPLEFGGAEPSQTTNRISHWTDRVNDLDVITVKRTNGKQTLESYQKAYDNELWLGSAAAIKGGYADEVVSVSCDSSLAGTHNQIINFMGLEIALVFSNCPIVTGILDIFINIKTRSGKTIRLEKFLKEGGQFGNACLNEATLCPADITLTPEKINEIKTETTNKFKINKDSTFIKTINR